LLHFFDSLKGVYYPHY